MSNDCTFDTATDLLESHEDESRDWDQLFVGLAC